MDSGTACRRARFQAGADGQVVECLPGPLVAQPASAGGQQQGGCLRGGHDLVAEPEVLVQPGDGGRVQRKVPGLAELGVAHSQDACCGIVVAAVEADRLSDATAFSRGPRPCRMTWGNATRRVVLPLSSLGVALVAGSCSCQLRDRGITGCERSWSGCRRVRGTGRFWMRIWLSLRLRMRSCGRCGSAA